MTFDLDRAWRVDPRVSMRPEPFGALLYHFGTRRLSFLKNQRCWRWSGRWPTTPAPGRRARPPGVAEAELPVYARALAALADSKMISERTAA